MAKNSFNFEAHLSRHSHNVSAGYTSSLTTGPIVPQYTDILGPGDTIYFTPKCFARLQDIAAPFFGEVDIHFDAFFVPLQMIYTAFGQVFAQTDDTISSLYETGLGVNVGDNFPLLATTWHANKDLRSHYYGHVECLGKETMRLLDALDCNPLSVLSGSNFETSGSPVGVEPVQLSNMIPVVSPWLFAAYQACYQKFYRNDELERFDINSYNIDRYFNNYSVQSPFTQDRLWRLRYAQRPADYFTSVKVSPLASAVNSIGIPVLTDDPNDVGSRFPVNGGMLQHTLEEVNDYLGFDSSSYVFENKTPDSSSVFPNSDGHNFVSSSRSFETTSVGHDNDWYPSAANIRALFAVDKFTRIYGRAGKTYDEQIEAHFGIKIPHDVKHDLTHIKHWRMALTAEPIYSTADTGDGGSSLGQVGGQANSTLNANQEKFTAPVHGVFIICAYAVTKPRYFFTFNKLNLLMSRLDFPIPAFDKLGMQPLYAYEAYPKFLDFDLDDETQGDDPNTSVRIGWQRRYQQFKQKYNRVSPLYYNANITSVIPTESNFFSPYVLSRMPMSEDVINNEGASSWLVGQSMLLPARELFERPDALNGVLSVGYNGDWSPEYWGAPQSVFDTDPILIDFYCDAKKVSWMSETGEPDL